MITYNNTVVAIYGAHADAEAAVGELHIADFDMNKVSMIARDHHTEEHVIGYYRLGDRMKYWGKAGAFWGGIWVWLSDSAFFLIPGVGPVLVAGPLVGSIVDALEGAVVLGGVSALGAGLGCMGVPEKDVLQYEAEIKAGKIVLLAQGTAEEAMSARVIMGRTGPEAVEIFHRAAGGNLAEIV